MLKLRLLFLCCSNLLTENLAEDIRLRDHDVAQDPPGGAEADG